MKIIHCADLHLGIERGPIDQETKIPGRILDFLESFDVLIDFVLENCVDVLLIAGDVFHTHNPSPMLLDAFASKISKVATVCSVVILVGNHDTAGPLYKKSAVSIFGELNIDNVYLGNKFETLNVETAAGILQVSTFPYPSRHLLSMDAALISWDDYQTEIHKQLITIRKDIDVTLPAVFLGHFSITGSVYGSERAMLLGQDAEVDIFDLLNWDPGDGPINCIWDYIALGHIHHHQEVLDKPPVVYAGSLDRVDFGEEKDDKGFIVVDINLDDTGKTLQKSVDWEFISVDPRPMLTVTIDAVDKQQPRNYIVSQLNTFDVTDAIVRVVVNVTNALDASSEELTNLLYKNGAYWVRSVNVKVPVEVTVRFELDKPAAAYSEFELLELFLDTSNITDDEFNDLLDLAEDIMSGAV